MCHVFHHLCITMYLCSWQAGDGILLMASLCQFPGPPMMQVLSRLNEWKQHPENKRRHVMLMPSIRDAHSHPVFPQPPFMLPTTSGDSSNVRSIQSPCCFVSEDLTVAACSQDVLLHLSAGEIAHSQGQDRMGALASHVIGQQRYTKVVLMWVAACHHQGVH
jgi:hypothetical protein